MRSSATLVLISTAALLAVSAAPAVAGPPERYDIPESCVLTNGGRWLECTSQRGLIKETFTPTGGYVFTANTDTRFAVYDGPSKRSPLLFRDNLKEHVNSSTRDGEVKVEHRRTVEKRECTTVTTFVLAGGDVRRNDVKSTCG